MAGQMHVILGTGPLGKSVMRALLARGEQVRMVNRSGKGDVAAGVEVRAGDLYSLDSVRTVTADAAVVYQCAQPEYHEWPEKFPPLQAAILEGTAASGAKLVLGDNLYVYGDPKGQPLTEQTPAAPITRKGAVRAAMSRAALDAHKAGKLQVAIVRASDFFGPHDMVSGGQYFYPIIAGKKVSGVGNIDHPHTFSYISDFGTALATVGAHDDAYGQVWHAPSVAPLTQRDLFTFIAAEAQTKPSFGSINKMMMRMAGLFIPGAREMVEMMYEFTQPFVMDSSKFTKRFNIRATPIQDAARESVAWFKANPEQKH
ncbi:MAG: NAD-dependent epimerase/dehydratase family protein [Chloroflexota bacterium]|nr:NAD-dependent epimerase/dehydratase family protein [Chloroflexota bacterium]